MDQHHDQERVADPLIAQAQQVPLSSLRRPGWHADRHAVRADAPGVGLIIFQELPSLPLFVTCDGCSTQPHAQYYGTVVLTLTVLKVTVPITPALWEVTAIPASTDPLMFSVTPDPASGVQVVPSLEV
jgi:hypothetical protein